MNTEKKWNIDKDSLVDPAFTKMNARFSRAKAQMAQRTAHHELYGLLAKNKSIHEFNVRKGRTQYFSEGSTQYILRKTLADTIQRVPDGELVTPYDKASIEHILTEYIFNNKVMWSEFEGIDMMSNLTNVFKMSFIYGFAPVRIGFEKDYDNDARISFNLEQWSDVFINPDCKDIRRPQVVYHRQYLSKDDVKALINEETGDVHDPTYKADAIKYLLDEDMFTAKEYESEKMADKLKGSTSIQSVELITEYRRGEKKFITYCPTIKAVFREVPNYDPRLGIPWVFGVLEVDPDFPLGVSQVEFLLADQQFNDLFQTSAYKNLLLAMEPPIMVSGWETNPSSYRFEPRKIWNLGNNPNQVKVEPVKIDNTILSGWANTREAIASSMLRNLNVMDGTVANDSGTGFSKTAPGVEAQMTTKTININQYQKRMEYFVAEYANMALRMYINALGGVHEMTVDEETRRKLIDIGREDLINGNKISIDFDILETDLLDFQVRAGSLVELKEDQERQALSDMIQPFIQNLNGWSEENRTVVENEILLPVMKRMLELSDSDISQSLADSLNTQIAKLMMADMQAQIDSQQAQLNEQSQAIANMQQQQPEAQQNMGMSTNDAGLPVMSDMPTPPAPTPEMGESPADQVMGALTEEETPGQQVDIFDDLFTI